MVKFKEILGAECLVIGGRPTFINVGCQNILIKDSSNVYLIVKRSYSTIFYREEPKNKESITYKKPATHNFLVMETD